METDKVKPTGKGCLSLLLAFILGIPVAILGAFVLSQLWEWFITPITSWPSITIVQAYGISWIVGFFRTIRRKSEYDLMKFEDTIKLTLTNVFSHLIIWFGGWIITLFM